MVGSAGWVEAKVIPISKVTKPPHRHTELGAVGGFGSSRTSKIFKIELIPLRIGEKVALRVGSYFVVAGFVVIVACQVGLRAMKIKESVSLQCTIYEKSAVPHQSGKLPTR